MAPKTDKTIAAIEAIAIVALLIVFFTNQAFFGWAFARHQNTASWIMRPVLMLPFCYFAWKRSLAGIMASILAILTSMFWFPAPAVPRDDVLRFLAMEREILSAGWSGRNIAGAIAVILYAWALAAAFWRRSWKIGIVVAAIGALGKSLWSVISSPDAGYSILPYAIGGFVVLVVAVFAAVLLLRRR